MFIDEVKNKLKLPEGIDFTVSVIGGGAVAVSGVKSVVLTSAEIVRFRLKHCQIEIKGAKLQLVEIGGGDAYVKGEISGVEFV
jgi:sporulation protein YqfC